MKDVRANFNEVLEISLEEIKKTPLIEFEDTIESLEKLLEKIDAEGRGVVLDTLQQKIVNSETFVPAEVSAKLTPRVSSIAFSLVKDYFLEEVDGKYRLTKRALQLPGLYSLEALTDYGMKLPKHLQFYMHQMSKLKRKFPLEYAWFQAWFEDFFSIYVKEARKIIKG